MRTERFETLYIPHTSADLDHDIRNDDSFLQF